MFCSAEAKAKGCPTWMSKRCAEEQQLPAWVWMFAAEEQLPSSEDGALVQQPHRVSDTLAG